MSFSQWLKTDLHIHSHASKQTKRNDYSGNDLTYENLIEALQKENVNIFSITDHNIINKGLYEKLIEQREKLQSLNMNFIIGAELDFVDNEIHDKEFHMLIYFDTYDLGVIEKIFKELYNVDSFEKIGFDLKKISVSDFFRTTFSNGIKNIITVPHFGNKHKGLPVENEIDSFVYTVFNALEDSNNRTNLIKSLKTFKKFQYNDVPLVIFSDNHDIAQYPLSKNGDITKQTFTHILGNINFPFNSLKTAFQDVNTRICIESVNDTRQRTTSQKFIKEIIFNDHDICKLSPYQNTIIGGFGSGKSFLLNLILSGNEHVHKNYKDLVKKYSNFKLRMSDNAIRNSLSEIESEIKIVKFEQQKNIYFEHHINEDYKDYLEKCLFIEFPKLEPKNKSETDILECFSSLYENIEKSKNITDIFNYEVISEQNKKPFSFSQEVIEEFDFNSESTIHLTELLEKEKNMKILGFDVYKEDEIDLFSKTILIIRNKHDILNSSKDNTNEILSIISTLAGEINNKSSSHNELLSTSTKIIKNIQDDLIHYIECLANFKNSSDKFMNSHSLQTFSELKEMSTEKDFFDYKLIAKYDSKDDEVSLNKIVLTENHRDKKFFQGVIATIHDSESYFAQKKSFSERINKFNTDFYSNFTNICYDIIDNNISVFKKSAGEKANVIIDIIFCKVKDFSEKNISSIVLLDQPEDNLDNKGINDKIVKRIRELKKESLLPQFICISHNPNISITADSENIILASKKNDICEYSYSGIENDSFTQKVCTTLEGGIDALKRRGEKFSIPLIKELDKGVTYE